MAVQSGLRNHPEPLITTWHHTRPGTHRIPKTHRVADTHSGTETPPEPQELTRLETCRVPDTHSHKLPPGLWAPIGLGHPLWVLWVVTTLHRKMSGPLVSEECAVRVESGYGMQEMMQRREQC